MDRPVRPILPTLGFFVISALVACLPAQASTAMALAGRVVTLSVTAHGSPPFTYRWYKDGIPITGATGPTYQISTVDLADAGSYSAEVSNGAGSIISDEATLTVHAAPVFTTHPQSLAVTAGSAATLAASARGTPAPTYQWRKNGTAIVGATASSYTIAAVAPGDAATYSVVATNGAGATTSQGAILSISGGPATGRAPAQAISLAAAADPVASAAATAGISPAGAAGDPTATAIGGFAHAAASYTVWRRSGPVDSAAVGSGPAPGTAGSPDPGVDDWHVTHIDFRSDGETDVLWQSTATGKAELWVMDGPAVTEVIPWGDLPFEAPVDQ